MPDIESHIPSTKPDIKLEFRNFFIKKGRKPGPTDVEEHTDVSTNDIKREYDTFTDAIEDSEVDEMEKCVKSYISYMEDTKELPDTRDIEGISPMSITKLYMCFNDYETLLISVLNRLNNSDSKKITEYEKVLLITRLWHETRQKVPATPNDVEEFIKESSIDHQDFSSYYQSTNYPKWEDTLQNCQISYKKSKKEYEKYNIMIATRLEWEETGKQPTPEVLDKRLKVIPSYYEIYFDDWEQVINTVKMLPALKPNKNNIFENNKKDEWAQAFIKSIQKKGKLPHSTEIEKLTDKKRYEHLKYFDSFRDAIVNTLNVDLFNENNSGLKLTYEEFIHKVAGLLSNPEDTITTREFAEEHDLSRSYYTRFDKSWKEDIIPDAQKIIEDNDSRVYNE
jgi:hypothetical protein